MALVDMLSRRPCNRFYGLFQILVPDKCPLVDRFIRYDSDVSTLTELPGLPDRYLLPPQSSFLISDYTKLQPLMEAGKYVYWVLFIIFETIASNSLLTCTPCFS